jgi:hypothetical protein
MQTIIEHSSRFVSQLARHHFGFSMFLHSLACFLFVLVLVQVVPTRGSGSCNFVSIMTCDVSVQVRMQTDVAYRTSMEVQLGLVFSFSGRLFFA